MKKVYICSDSVTGIFSAIYDAWKAALKTEQLGIRLNTEYYGIALKGMVEQELFCEYVESDERMSKVMAVEKLIQKHLGSQAYWCIYHAILSNDPQKADAVLGMMLEARNIPISTKIMEHLSHPKVQKVFELSRKVANEAHSFKEFIRFEELQNGILFSEIAPKYQILVCLGDYFQNRFPMENWMIYDKTHQMFLVHEKQKHWIVALNQKIDIEKAKQVSRSEVVYAKLWKGFFESISIKERESYERQRQHFPLKYRKHVTEFKKT